MNPELTLPAREASLADAARRDRFVELYQRSYHSVVRYAICRAPADQAEDIAHETFAVAWRRLGEVPPGGELPWLYTVARNVIMSTTRKARQHSRFVASLDPPASEPDHADAAGARETALAALESLSESDRELVKLTAWEGLSPREAAVALDCPPAVIYLRLHRLRKRLEVLLDQPDQQEDQ